LGDNHKDGENKINDKIILGGEYFEFKLKKFEWERTNNPTNDFLTLLRQTVNIILGFQGIITREFISMDGFFIVTVCFGHEYNLTKVYEYLQMNKFLDISMIDLMSLEPLDSKGRPLRLHKTIQQRKNWEEAYKTSHGGLFDQIKIKTKEINYLKMVREFNGVWDKDLVREKNATFQIYEHVSVPISTWENYLKYLTNLSERVKVIRREHFEKKSKLLLNFHSKFYFKTDFGILMKKLTEKSEKDDYFHLENMKNSLNNSLNGN
jgi:hypothetical protein